MNTFCFIPKCLQQNNLFNLSLNFANAGNYLLAFEHIKTIISTNCSYLLDIYICLYHQLNLKDDISVRFLISKLYFHTKDYENTYQELLIILDKHPTHTDSLQLLYTLYQMNYKKGDLSSFFESHFNKYPSSNFLLDKIPIIYLNENKHEKLIKFYKNRIEQEPKQYFLWDQLASLYLKNKNYQKAKESYLHLLKINSKFVYTLIPKLETFCSTFSGIYAIHFLLLEIYIHKCDLKNTLIQFELILIDFSDQQHTLLKYCKKLLATYPDNCEILRLMASLYLNTKRYTECILHLQKLFTLSSSYKDQIIPILHQILSDIPSHVSAKLLLCDLYFHEKNPTAYVETLTQLISDNYPDQNEILKFINRIESCKWVDTSYFFYLKTIFYLHNKDDRFYSYSQKVSRSDLSDIVTLKIIDYYINKKMFNKALKTIQLAIPTLVYDIRIHHLIKSLQKKVIKNDISKLENSESIHKNKDASRLFLKLGLLNLRHGDLSKATIFFQKIQTQHLLYHYSQLLLARCFFEQGRFDLVIHVCESLLKYSSSNEISCIHSIYFIMACSYIHLGQILKGIEYFEKIYVSNQLFPYVNQLLPIYKNFVCKNFQSPYLTAFYFNKAYYVSTFYDFDFLSDKYCKDLESPEYLQNKYAMSLVFSHSYLLAKNEFELVLQKNPEYLPAQLNYFIVLLLINDKNKAKLQLDLLNKKYPEFILHPLFKSLYDIGIENDSNHALSLLKDSLCYKDASFHIQLSQYFLLKNDIKNSTDHLTSPRLAIFYPFIQRYYSYLQLSSLDISYWTTANIPDFTLLVDQFQS